MNWYQAVCFEKNKDDIILNFNYFGLKYGEDFYEVQHWDGTTAIFLQINSNGKKDVFKIILDKEAECAKILYRNNSCNLNSRERYHVIRSSDGEPVKFYGLDVWYNVLNFIFTKIGRNKANVKFYV